MRGLTRSRAAPFAEGAEEGLLFSFPPFPSLLGRCLRFANKRFFARGLVHVRPEHGMVRPEQIALRREGILLHLHATGLQDPTHVTLHHVQ